MIHSGSIWLATHVSTQYIFQASRLRYKLNSREMDPAITRSKTRSTRGLTHETAQSRTNHPPNPFLGSTRCFPIWKRERAIDILNTTDKFKLTVILIGCLERSICRCERRIVPFRMNEGVGGQKEQLLLWHISFCLIYVSSYTVVRYRNLIL